MTYGLRTRADRCVSADGQGTFKACISPFYPRQTWATMSIAPTRSNLLPHRSERTLIVDLHSVINSTRQGIWILAQERQSAASERHLARGVCDYQSKDASARPRIN